MCRVISIRRHVGMSNPKKMLAGSPGLVAGISGGSNACCLQLSQSNRQQTTTKTKHNKNLFAAITGILNCNNFSS